MRIKNRKNKYITGAENIDYQAKVESDISFDAHPTSITKIKKLNIPASAYATTKQLTFSSLTPLNINELVQIAKHFFHNKKVNYNLTTPSASEARMLKNLLTTGLGKEAANLTKELISYRKLKTSNGEIDYEKFSDTCLRVYKKVIDGGFNSE